MTEMLVAARAVAIAFGRYGGGGFATPGGRV